MLKEEYKNLPKEKFVLVNENKKLHDKELVTKPIGFFKDAMHRFGKNKGSIVGAIVIGILILYSIIAPLFSPYAVSYNDNYYSFMLPNLLDNENIDFLDGAKNVDTNFVSFIESYSKGVETGHNAIKRQEYKYNEETERYYYRLDSVRDVGTVFMKSVTREDYYAIQEYQDEAGVQIIYPITDVDKRPKNQKNVNDANYWYETMNDPSSTNDVPINYTKNDDGSYTLTNIYKKFTVPVLSASDQKKRAIRAVVEDKGTGYAIKFISKAGSSYGGIKMTEDQFHGYLGIKHENGDTYVEYFDSKDDAAVFIYDDVHNVYKTYIDGHTDTAEDGYYFFGLNKERGSNCRLLPEADLDNADIIPLRFYEENADEPVTTQVALNTEYYFAVNRRVERSKSFYVTNFFNDDVHVGSSGAADITFEKVGDYYRIFIRQGKARFYIGVEVSGNDNNIKRVAALDVDQAALWTFDTTKTAFKVALTGHTDATLDKDYYLAFDSNPADDYKASLIPGEQLSDIYLPFKPILDQDTKEPVTTIEEGTVYRLFGGYYYRTDNYIYSDGTFKGDSYFSKMRVEGEDEYLYDYAILKDGDQFEIRVSYYDYYIYYHTYVLKDGITKPIFIFGTTQIGQDIFTCLASGARFSFILAISVASVNLIVGAIYGAIEGYYGGKVDMVMERIVEILSAVPFMIVITLLKYHMEKTPQVLILFIAFFLTGWIGMSGLVRMQFYRFKNQEYVLAARTLGAKDARIMFKHIFPNALGTIVTSCVLVIPGMIFSETSLSYLGIINLNSGNMTSVGTLLAGGQPFISTYPHMMIFPAIFISLLMLCFNLFGNGLRDAFNPSLRGTED